MRRGRKIEETIVDMIVSVLKGERDSGYIVLTGPPYYYISDAEHALALINEALRRLENGRYDVWGIPLVATLDDGMGIVRAQTKYGIIQLYCSYNFYQGAPPQYIHVWMVKRA